MVLAEMVCSDEGCDFTVEIVAEERELAVLVCDGCGCCLQAVSVCEVELAEVPRPPIPLRTERRSELRDAA
jgi:hypothetical protein